MSQGARSQMRYRALVQRPADSETNPDGHPSFAGWRTLHGDLPCYIWEIASQEAFSVNQIAIIKEVHAFVPRGTDIKVSDRIAVVKDQNGRTQSSDVYRVEAVNRRRNSHIELDLKVVNG